MKRLFPIFMAILASSILLLNQTGAYSVTQAQIQALQVPPVTSTPIPLPTIAFSADPPVIVQGDSVTLDWEVEGASEGRSYISPAIPEISAPLSATASVVIWPQSTTTYRLEACNQAGCSSREVTVEAKVRPPLIRQFWTDKSLLLQGDTATLTWDVDIAGTATILFYLDHPAEGEEVPASSSKTVAPEQTTTYRLRACNETDCDHKEITIVVNLRPPVVRRFEADPEVIDQGQSTTLRWEIEGAETGYLYPDTRGGGQVSAASWKTTPPLEDTTVYKLVACHSAGCNSKEVTVIVNTAPQEPGGSPQAGEQEIESTPPKLSIAPPTLEEQQLKMEISNTGSVTAYDIVVTLSGSDIEPQERTIDQLEGGETQEVVFRLKKEPGSALRIEVQSTNAPPEFQEVSPASLTPTAGEILLSASVILYISAAIIALALLGLTALVVFYIARQRQPVIPTPADSLPDDLERLWRQRL